MATYIINISGGGGNGITEQEAQALLADYQPKLVSGTNIKTVNNESLLIAGNDTDVTIQTAQNNE